MDSGGTSLNLLGTGASTEAAREGFPLTPEGLSGWLAEKNVLPTDARLLSYADLDLWHRAGGETYQATFAIEWATAHKTYSNRVRLKAIVTINSDLALQVWTRRRNLLGVNGVPVAQWFSSGSALILEQYYPSDYKATRPRQRLADIAHKLDELGFAPRNFLLDIRCDDQGSPFYVDFGEDLGEPGVSKDAIATAQYSAEFGDPE